MKEAWSNYVGLAIARQILTEAGKEDPNIRCSQLSLEEYPILGFLADSPPHFSGKTSKAANSLLHCSGKIRGPFGTQQQYFEVENGSHIQHITLDRQTVFQTERFPEGETLHIYGKKAKGSILARYIVTEGAAAAFTDLCGHNISPAVIDSFLKLSPRKQKAYALLAVNKELRRSVLYALAYLSAKLFADRAYRVEQLDSIAQAFNSSICSTVNCTPIEPSLFFLYATDLFGNTAFDIHTDALFFNPTRVMPLTFFAILGGFSPWHQQGLSTPQILAKQFRAHQHNRIIESICTMAPAHQVHSVLTQMVDYTEENPKIADTFFSIFFKVLCRCKGLTDETLFYMTRVMFQDTLYQEQSQYMRNMLCGPNGDRFRRYVLDSFRAACQEKNAQFHFCAAAITNTERHLAGKNPVKAAVEGISSANNIPDYLLNVMCLGLLAWDGCILDKRYTTEGLELTDEMVKKFLCYLEVPDKLFFPIVACALHDLVICGVIQAELLKESHRQAAIAALTDEDTRKRAEELLCLIALPQAEQPADTIPEQLQKTYLDRYDACLRDLESMDSCEMLFAAACHLGAFPTTAERQQQLKNILLYTDKKKVSVDDSNRWRIGHLLHSLDRSPYLWTTCTTQVDPAVLGQELTQQKKTQLICLGQQLAAENRQHKVTDVQEALDLIKFITPYACNTAAQNQPDAVNLVNHIQMEVPESGSYLIVNWFYILCRYGHPEQVLHYYRTHQQILDRPISMPCTPRGKRQRHLYEQYKSYIKSSPRVLAGLRTAVGSGNLKVLSAFMDSSFRDLVDNQQFVQYIVSDDRIAQVGKELCRIYNGRYGTDSLSKTKTVQNNTTDLQELCKKIDQMLAELEEKTAALQGKRTLPGNTFLPSSSFSDADRQVRTLNLSSNYDRDYSLNRYYDDLAVVRYHLLEKTGLGYQVMMLGYNDDFDLVKLAVQANGKILQYASRRLQEDNEIGLAALQQTGLALPYVKGSLRNDIQAVTPLLLAGQCVLKDIPSQYCEDPEVVKKAVMQNPSQLQYASPQLRADRQIVSIAISQKQNDCNEPAAVQWASEDLRDDKELMLQAVKANPRAFRHISPRLKQDPDILAIYDIEQVLFVENMKQQIMKLLEKM